MKKKMLTALSILFVVGCTTANIGQGTTENQMQSATLFGSYESVFKAAAQVAAVMKWDIVNSDINTGVINATYEGNLRRWGDEVSIIVNEGDDGTNVTVRSKLGQWPNREYISGYLANLAAQLGQ